MEVVVLVVHLFIALGMTGVILLQRSEGGGLGIGGGGGGIGGGLFSARGAANVLTRATAFLAAAFFVTSITLTVLATGRGQPASIIDTPVSGQPAQPPAAPAPFDPLAPANGAPAAQPSSEPAPAPAEQPAEQPAPPANP